MKKLPSVLFDLSLLLFAFSLFAAEKKPVAEAANPMFLKGMVDRPWWNNAWRKRLPVVVSEMSTNKVSNFIVDTVVDFGEKVDPKEVRIVTGYGEEVPCWAGAAEANSLRIQFKTDLRVLENKPFFVYYGNPKAEAQKVPTTVNMVDTEKRVTIDNGRLHLEFSKDSRYRSPLHVFRIIGSESVNELVANSGGTAEFGLTPTINGDKDGQWFHFLPTKVVAEQVSPWKAVVTAESELVKMTYILYADSDRLDYIYEPLNQHRITGIYTAWGSGGGIAWDDFVYPSLAGTLRTMRAALDFMSDSGGELSYSKFGDSCSEGWFSIRDRRVHTAVGQFYNPADFNDLAHQHNDWNYPAAWMRLVAKVDWKKPANILRGAAFGTYKDSGAIRNDYYEWACPPKVLIGEAQPFRDIREKRPDFRYDFCAAFATGLDDRLRDSKCDERFLDFEADQLAKRIKRLGMNCMMFGGLHEWEQVGLDRETYDYLAGLTNHPNFKAWKASCSWEESQNRFKRGQEIIRRLHDQNFGVYYWGSFMGHSRCWPKNSEATKGYKKFREVDLRIARQQTKLGYDAIWCGIVGNEGPDYRPDDRNKWTDKYWLWPEKERREYLDYLDSYVDHVRDFTKAVKETNPEALVVTWGCDNGGIANVQRQLETAGLVDVVIDEIMVGASKNHGKNKTSSAQMRSMFDNEVHTVWNHFWERYATDDIRIGDCDQAFVFGVNGYNQETDQYGYVDRDNPANMADFYHFARYTGLADISAKLVPVKYAVVYRDSNEVREDCMQKEEKNGMGHTWTDPYPLMSLTEVAAHNWTGARGFHCDRVINQFFNLKSLSRYRILALPHNAHLPKEQFEIVKKFVENGGVCFVEGEDFPFVKDIRALTANTILTDRTYSVYDLGKGRFVYANGHNTIHHAVMLNQGGALRTVLAKAANTVEPVIFEHKDRDRLTGMLRGDGKRWIFGAYAEDNFNGKSNSMVKVKLDIPVASTNVQRSTSNVQPALYALDVKRAVRVPFNGEVEYFQAPGQCAFILIGDDETTKIPAAKVVEANDAGNRNPLGLLPGAAKGMKERAELGDFKDAAHVIMFCNGDKDGNAKPNHRFAECAIAQDIVTPKTYSKVKFLDYLAKAKALYIGYNTDRRNSEIIFADCYGELKEFLKRGGTILFHCCSTPDSARRLFAEIGVFDPDANGGRVKVRDGWCSEKEGTGRDHVLYKSIRAIDTPWGRGGMLQFFNAFTKWDPEKQQVFYHAKPAHMVDGKDTVMLVAQENVLGKGKVVFEENDRAFTTWYENQIYGENVISYMIDMNAGDHIRKVNLLNGGPGIEAKPEYVER